MYQTKDTNPKDAVGVAKAPMSTISAPVMMEVGVAMLEGARKYGRHNYRAAGVRSSVYYDATMRHLMAWWEGENIDPDSGLSHVTKAIASLMVLRDSMIQANWTDDRPPVTPPGWVKTLNTKVEEMIKRYPESKPAVTAMSLADARREEVASIEKAIYQPPPPLKSLGEQLRRVYQGAAIADLERDWWESK